MVIVSKTGQNFYNFYENFDISIIFLRYFCENF